MQHCGALRKKSAQTKLCRAVEKISVNGNVAHRRRNFRTRLLENQQN